MDLKKTEKTLLKLEENAVKVNEVTKSVEKFEGLVSEVKTISEGIKNNSASIELRISDVDKKLMENMNDLSKELRERRVIYQNNLWSNQNRWKNTGKNKTCYYYWSVLYLSLCWVWHISMAL